jgi:putative transposase
MRQRYSFFITAYVVMPEHVHLLISEPEHGSLARALQAVKLSVTVKRPERPFWTPGTTTSMSTEQES